MVKLIIPCEIMAGLSLAIAISLEDYPAPDWSLSLHLRGAKAVDLEAAQSGAGHTFTATATETATWSPGLYAWALRATRGAETVDISRGRLTIIADMVEAGDGFDARTENEKALEAIDAVIARRATVDQERYRINNRELYRTAIADLLKLRAFYVAKVRRERARLSGASAFRKIPVRFS